MIVCICILYMYILYSFILLCIFKSNMFILKVSNLKYLYLKMHKFEWFTLDCKYFYLKLIKEILCNIIGRSYCQSYLFACEKRVKLFRKQWSIWRNNYVQLYYPVKIKSQNIRFSTCEMWLGFDFSKIENIFWHFIFRG